jgi:general secretion pathway protein G
MLRRLMRRRRAFSLIELLVVLVILALLAGIVLPRFLARQGDAQVAAAKSQIGQFKSALRLYMLDNNGQPPTTEQGLQALVEEPSTSPRPAKWSKYLEMPAIPLDPWKNPYEYSADGTDYLIQCWGADGKPDGQGNDADLDSNMQ